MSAYKLEAAIFIAIDLSALGIEILHVRDNVFILVFEYRASNAHYKFTKSRHSSKSLVIEIMIAFDLIEHRTPLEFFSNFRELLKEAWKARAHLFFMITVLNRDEEAEIIAFARTGEHVIKELGVYALAAFARGEGIAIIVLTGK